MKNNVTIIRDSESNVFKLYDSDGMLVNIPIAAYEVKEMAGEMPLVYLAIDGPVDIELDLIAGVTVEVRE